MYFSQTFKALNFDFEILRPSWTFKVRANPYYDRLVSSSCNHHRTLTYCCLGVKD